MLNLPFRKSNFTLIVDIFRTIYFNSVNIMSRAFLSLILLLIVHLIWAQNLTIYKSNVSVKETVKQLVAQIQSSQELIFFEIVDHNQIAKDRGLELSPTRSILFEDPELSTLLLNCRQTAALDLPLEIIVWEEFDDVYIGFMDPKFMKRRFMISDCDDIIDQLTRLMIRVTMNALREMK